MFRLLLLKSIIAGILFIGILFDAFNAIPLKFNHPFITNILLIVGGFAGSYWVKSKRIEELLLVVGIGGIICLVISILIIPLLSVGLSIGLLNWNGG